MIKIFRNISELFDNLSRATFLDNVMMILLLLLFLIVMFLLLHFVSKLILSLLGFEYRIAKISDGKISGMKRFKEKIESWSEEFNLRTLLQFKFIEQNTKIKSLASKLEQKNDSNEKEIIMIKAGTKSSLEKLYREIKSNNSEIATVNKQYEEFLKIYIATKKELESYQEGYDYSRNKLMIKKLVTIIKDIESKKNLDVKHIKENLLFILMDFSVVQIEANIGEAFDEKVHKVVSTQSTQKKSEHMTISSIVSNGYGISMSEGVKVLEYPEVIVYKFEEVKADE